MATLHYYVDWNNDGLFSHAKSDITQYVMPASWKLGRSVAHEYDSAGTASITLDNSSSLFSSFNAASPIYGKILPNIRVRITMTSGGVTTMMFQGFLESLLPTVGMAPGTRLNTADLVAYGVLAQFNDGTVSVPLQENIGTGAALAAMLDADGYSATDRTITAGLTTISKWWARPGSSRMQVMRDLQAAEFGRLREGKNGYLSFENRANPFTAPRNVPQATYGTGTLRIWNLKQEDPLLGVFNIINSQIHTFNISEDILLVTVADVAGNLGGVPPIIPAHGSLTVDIDYPNDSSPGNYIAVDSWSMVDYEAFTLADRTGMDITPDVTAVKTAKGSRLTIVFSNANAQDAHLTMLRAHGVAVVEGDPVAVSSEDAVSEGRYRKREYPYPSSWLTYLPDGQKYCDYIISVFKDLRPRLTFDVKGDYDANHLNEVRTRDIGDRIRVVASLADFGLAIDAEFIIDSLSYSVDNAKQIIMQVGCTQAPATQLGALATPYDPKTIPEPTAGGEPHVPDEPWTNAIVNGSDIRIGCLWKKWNSDIDQAELRALCITDGSNPAYVDLRIPSEGGTLAHDGYKALILTDMIANYGGLAYTISGLAIGRWYFAFRGHNGQGWSVWSDGNDVPRYVKDFADTEDIARSDIGPPAKWTVSPPAPGPTPNTCVVKVSRPQVNGNVIEFVVFQIKSVKSEAWNRFDANLGISDWGECTVLFDASAVGVRYNPKLGILECMRGGGFTGVYPGALMLVDVRSFKGENPSGEPLFGQTFGRIKSNVSQQHAEQSGGGAIRCDSEHITSWSEYLDCYATAKRQSASGTSPGWDLHQCIWNCVDKMPDPQHITGFNGFGLGHEPEDGWFTDVRLKIVNSPWGWNKHGYFGSPVGQGGYVDHPDYGNPWEIAGGDRNSKVFTSPPIAYPGDVSLSDIQARAVFGNPYSFSDDDTHSDNGSASSQSGGPQPIKNSPVLSVDAGTGNAFFIVLTQDSTLDLINGTDGQPILIIVTQDDIGGHQLYLGTGINIGQVSYSIALQAGARTYLGFIYDLNKNSYDLAPPMGGY